ncbi:hypothetical protein Cflav_PD6021 [Pedosphaera parvula Ellin514]|uniref:Transposase IS66 central domain-containing protein n=1 Tax=Pedosphaera parvula (strain Ellin514) TaxID=320771 RepID=B9XA45_PEDPL|nr:hypothetical protein Cflav_PD6021 [Pedosphaera parvula Ellin514]
MQLGPRAWGVAAQLNKQHGLTVRKTCAVLRELFQLRLSPGGLTQALARVAGKVEPAYEKLLARLRAGPCVHSDETSWWVDGPGYWLWVFANQNTTVYQVAKGRGRAIVAQALGEAFAGVLVSDCLAIYEDVNPRQQKCYSHHLKAIKQAGEGHPSAWLDAVRGLLLEAMEVKRQPLVADEKARRRAELEARMRQLLALPRPTNLEEKVRGRLEKQKTTCSPFWTWRRLRPPITWPSASCGQP